MFKPGCQFIPTTYRSRNHVDAAMSRYHSYAMIRHQSLCHMGHFVHMTLRVVSRRTTPIQPTSSTQTPTWV